MLLGKERQIADRVINCENNSMLHISTYTDGEGLELRVYGVDVGDGEYYFKEQLYCVRLQLDTSKLPNNYEYLTVTDKGFEIANGSIFLNKKPELKKIVQEVLDETYSIISRVFNVKAFL